MRLRVGDQIVGVLDDCPPETIVAIEASLARAKTLQMIEHDVRLIHGATSHPTPTCRVCVDVTTGTHELYPCPTLRTVRRILRVSRA